jgi:hypothetical protein
VIAFDLPINLLCRHHALRTHGAKGLAQVLLSAEMHGHIVVGQSFEVQGNSQSVRGATAKEALQIHHLVRSGSGLRMASSSPRALGRRLASILGFLLKKFPTLGVVNIY